MIVAEDLYKGFDGVPVLQGASLAVRTGEIVALIGPSGDGKSVFLKHVAGLLRPDRGRVLFDGKDLARLRPSALADLRSHFGFLFQGGALFDSMTVFDNVAFPLREKTRLREPEIRARVRASLEQVGLEDVDEKYPAQLSGGMAKRVALARAVILAPTIMLFDEPTAGLDPIIAHAILDLIASMQRRLGFGGILVTHEIPAVFAFVQQVAMLYRGRMQFVGTPQELMTAADPMVRAFVHGSLPPGLLPAGGDTGRWQNREGLAAGGGI
jgi:phospholipid/cholesterol/gamma-HCH transport system ATP-binding protein